ncbi:MAG TPA: MarR family transcriptional regulator [Vicinamibacteria bacterium]
MPESIVTRVLQEAITLVRFYELRRDAAARSEKQSRARWEVLVAVGAGRTVPQIARRMGMARQSVQRVADLLAEARLVRFEPNPEHRRSPIARPTDEGLRVRDRLERNRRGWEEDMEDVVDAEDLETALIVLRAIRSAMEG